MANFADECLQIICITKLPLSSGSSSRNEYYLCGTIALLLQDQGVTSYFASHTFSTASVWNSLEPDIWSALSLAFFKSRLKTALFSATYTT